MTLTVESPWITLQTAKTLAGYARRSQAESDSVESEAAGFRRQMVVKLLEFWSALPQELLEPWDIDDVHVGRLDLTPYLPQQPEGRSIAYIRLDGYDGLAILGPIGITETIPEPLAHPLSADLHRFNVGMQAEHVSDRLLAIEAQRRSREEPCREK